MGEMRSVLLGLIALAGITVIQGYTCDFMAMLNIALDLEHVYDIQLGEAAQILGSFDDNEGQMKFIVDLHLSLNNKIYEYHGDCPEPLEKGIEAIKKAVEYAKDLTSHGKMPFPGECENVDRLREEILRCNVQVYESAKTDLLLLFKKDKLCNLGSDLMTCVERAMFEARCSKAAVETILKMNYVIAETLSDWGNCEIRSHFQTGYGEDDSKTPPQPRKCDWKEMNECALKLERDFKIELGEAALTFASLTPQKQVYFCREFQGNFSRCTNKYRGNCPDCIESALDGIEEAGQLICREVNQGKLNYPGGCELETLQMDLFKCNFEKFDGYELMRAIFVDDKNFICKSVNELFQCVDKAMERARCDPEQAYIMHKANSLMFERYAHHVDNCDVRPAPMWMRQRGESDYDNDDYKLVSCFEGHKGEWLILVLVVLSIVLLSTVICFCCCKRRRRLREQEKAATADTVCAEALPEKQPLGDAAGEEVVLKVPTGEENVSCSNPLYDTPQQEVLPTYSEVNIPPPAYNAEDP